MIDQNISPSVCAHFASLLFLITDNNIYWHLLPNQQQDFISDPCDPHSLCKTQQVASGYETCHTNKSALPCVFVTVRVWVRAVLRLEQGTD